ncbi:hypothetical protein SBA4_1010036 [Candidatus Sulfopaludibacter sp. SbA4]|nr:hypothetical protein SBA4_1010036 [Candidatus Sulfopaludibacter sp. SbA4]
MTESVAGFPLRGRLAGNLLLTRRLLYAFASQGFSPRISPCPAQAATCRTSNLHGGLRSSH